MFSRMSAERFEKERQSHIGPGSYRIPAVFDDGSVTSDKSQQQDGELSVGSFQVYEDVPERVSSKPQVAPRTPKRKTLGATKAGQENRAPLAQAALAGAAAKGGAAGGVQEGSDVEQLRRRLQNAEANVADIAVAKRSAARAHSQVQAKERQMEDLRRQVEDLIGHQAQAHKRIGELEVERNLHKKVLCDKDNTIAALQKSIQHSKAQIEDRNRRPEAHDLATTRELVVEQAHRLAEQDAELQERTQELEAVNKHLGGLEKRFVQQVAETEARLQELVKSQERIHSSVVDREREAVKRAQDLEGMLKEQRHHEAHLVGQLAVRQASLEATLEMLAQEQRARQGTEARAASLAGELEILRSQAQEAEKSRAEEQEASQQLGVKFADLRGRLFLAEQAQSLGEERRRQLEEALTAKDTEVAGLMEAREQLRREAEELQASKLEVEACNEVQSAELEALRLEVEQLRQGASPEGGGPQPEDVDATSHVPATSDPALDAKQGEAGLEPDSQESSDVPVEEESAQDGDSPSNTSVSMVDAEILESEPQSDTSMVVEDGGLEDHGVPSFAEAGGDADAAARERGPAGGQWASSRAVASRVVARAVEAALQTLPAPAPAPQDASSTAELQGESTVHAEDPCSEAN
mmetsp:Transcript_44409/g.106255  ORF Transcript_44409/g.106255 Transcript_44409/m.106255 type:complete len:638 (-) Transcript_44409:9-1922(-)